MGTFPFVGSKVSILIVSFPNKFQSFLFMLGGLEAAEPFSVPFHFIRSALFIRSSLYMCMGYIVDFGLALLISNDLMIISGISLQTYLIYVFHHLFDSCSKLYIWAFLFAIFLADLDLIIILRLEFYNLSLSLSKLDYLKISKRVISLYMKLINSCLLKIFFMDCLVLSFPKVYQSPSFDMFVCTFISYLHGLCGLIGGQNMLSVLFWF